MEQKARQPTARLKGGSVVWEMGEGSGRMPYIVILVVVYIWTIYEGHWGYCAYWVYSYAYSRQQIQNRNIYDCVCTCVREEREKIKYHAKKESFAPEIGRAHV